MQRTHKWKQYRQPRRLKKIVNTIISYGPSFCTEKQMKYFLRSSTLRGPIHYTNFGRRTAPGYRRVAAHVAMGDTTYLRTLQRRVMALQTMIRSRRVDPATGRRYNNQDTATAR